MLRKELIAAHVTREQKNIIQRASKEQERSVSNFIRKVALENAKKILENE